jgi:catechol 2,3-dioxygenase-like lactoylglutathione lyase family enzyme
MTFTRPQAIYFCDDVERSSAFYQRLGFDEVFRTPPTGEPIHVDLTLDGYRIGFASIQSAREHHDLQPVQHGQRATITLWTSDTQAAYEQLLGDGVRGLAEPRVWLDRLLIAWVEDPDGHPLQIVQNLEVPPAG